MRRASLGLPILLTVGALPIAPAAWAKNLCVGASPRT
jgi:hypothetical protein